MRLISLKYSEFEGRDHEWKIDTLSLPPIVLIVGRNATGKSRTLNVINSPANILSGRQVFEAGEYGIVLKDNGDGYEYQLKFENSVIVKEELFLNGENLMHRGEGGIGRISAQIESDDAVSKQVRIKFKVAGSEAAAVKKRDAIQHPFLEPLHCWAESVRLFSFGSFSMSALTKFL
jgi:hypothetical protein